ncbi:MAG: hypothetical protein CK522_01995, partial [Opitutia bacterium]
MSLPTRTGRSLSRASLMVAAALLGVAVSTAPQAKAANVYWDSDASTAGNSTTLGTNLGGSGTWDTSTANWYNGSAELAWNNANLDTAVLWGAGDYFPSSPSLTTVSLGAGITVGGLTFN